MTYEIIPSPGTLDHEWEAIEAKLQNIKSFAKTVHIDVLDGKFAPNTTFSDSNLFKKFTKDIFFEVHLMVDEPISYIESFAKAGFKRFIGQVERMSDQEEFIVQAKTYGQAGLAIDKQTEIEAIKTNIDKVDELLVMTVKAGFSGQSFIPELLAKVKTLREITDLPIEVDGGIDDKTIQMAKVAGANRFAVTSFIFNSSNPSESYSHLLEIIK